MTLRERFWNFVGHFDPFAKGALTQRDLRRHPIWEYATDSEGLPWRDETWRRPRKCSAIQWDECSLTVAATLTIRSGKRFEGDANVSTIDGIVDVPMGGIWVNDVWSFVTLQPSATICDFESHAYLWPLCELHFLPENAGHCRRLKCYRISFRWTIRRSRRRVKNWRLQSA